MENSVLAQIILLAGLLHCTRTALLQWARRNVASDRQPVYATVIAMDVLIAGALVVPSITFLTGVASARWLGPGVGMALLLKICQLLYLRRSGKGL